MMDQAGDRVARRGASDLARDNRWPARGGREGRVAKGPARIGSAWIRMFVRRYPLPAVSGIVAILLIALGLLAPWVSPDDPLRPNVLARAQEPSRQHW